MFLIFKITVCLIKFFIIIWKKKEIIVLNKVDLLSQKELKNKKMKFEEKLNKKVIQLSTFNKKLISNLKIKLLKNVS